MTPGRGRRRRVARSAQVRQQGVARLPGRRAHGDSDQSARDRGRGACPPMRRCCDVPGPIDMATVYVQPDTALRLLDEFERKEIPEIWLNPGAETTTSWPRPGAPPSQRDRGLQHHGRRKASERVLTPIAGLLDRPTRARGGIPIPVARYLYTFSYIARSAAILIRSPAHNLLEKRFFEKQCPAAPDVTGRVDLPTAVPGNPPNPTAAPRNHGDSGPARASEPAAPAAAAGRCRSQRAARRGRAPLRTARRRRRGHRRGASRPRSGPA